MRSHAHIFVTKIALDTTRDEIENLLLVTKLKTLDITCDKN